jgi:hypothetical protein
MEACAVLPDASSFGERLAARFGRASGVPVALPPSRR